MLQPVAAKQLQPVDVPTWPPTVPTLMMECW